MNMKLSYRDKVIFVVVIVLVVLAIGFFVFVKAKIQESQDVKANLAVKEQELQEVHDKIDTLPGLKTQLKDTIKEVDTLQKNFLDEELNFQADQYLYALLSDIPGIVKFNSMKISGEDSGELNAYFYDRNAVSYDIKMNADLTGDSLPQPVYDDYYDTWPSEPSEAVVQLSEVEVTFSVSADSDGSPDWDSILASFDKIAEHDKNIYLKSFSAGKSEGGEGEAALSSVVLTIDLFNIYHMDTSKAA